MDFNFKLTSQQLTEQINSGYDLNFESDPALAALRESAERLKKDAGLLRKPRLLLNVAK